MLKPIGNNVYIDRLKKLAVRASGIEVISDKPYHYGTILGLSPSVRIHVSDDKLLSEGDEVFYISASSLPVGDATECIVNASHILGVNVNDVVHPVGTHIKITPVDTATTTEAGLAVLTSRQYKRGKVTEVSAQLMIEISDDRCLKTGDEVCYDYDSGVPIGDGEELIISKSSILVCLTK